MKLTKHLCLSQKEGIAIKNFLDVLMYLDKECYDEFTKQIGVTSDFYYNLSDFFDKVKVDPWEK